MTQLPRLAGADRRGHRDLEDAPDAELEQTEEEVVDQATAARTIAELQAEIGTLSAWKRWRLRCGAAARIGNGASWRAADEIFATTTPTSDPTAAAVPKLAGSRIAPSPSQKLVIFTEHRDTLNYLEQRITHVARSPGGRGRDPRRHGPRGAHEGPGGVQAGPEVQVLVATDAAGEGINLQRAHLMVNYDLPWNPNRLEQRFGRIHRIGQTEVCHLWNLVAEETREGEVYRTLLEKLDEARRRSAARSSTSWASCSSRAAAAGAADRGDPLWRPARGPGAG